MASRRTFLLAKNLDIEPDVEAEIRANWSDKEKALAIVLKALRAETMFIYGLEESRCSRMSSDDYIDAAGQIGLLLGTTSDPAEFCRRVRDEVPVR